MHLDSNFSEMYLWIFCSKSTVIQIVGIVIAIFVKLCINYEIIWLMYIQHYYIYIGEFHLVKQSSVTLLPCGYALLTFSWLSTIISNKCDWKFWSSASPRSWMNFVTSSHTLITDCLAVCALFLKHFQFSFFCGLASFIWESAWFSGWVRTLLTPSVIP